MEHFEISPQILQKLHDKHALDAAFKSGKKISEILGFTPQALALMYKSALHFFSEHRYVESTKAFLFLTTLDQENFDYWLGLGMSVQMSGDYEAGIDAYEMAAFIDVENPVSYFYLSKCFFAIHDRENAKEALNMAIENAGDLPQYSELKQQALAALALIQKEL